MSPSLTKILPDTIDDTPCGLGESPLWHPSREELFWVDLPSHTLHQKSDTSKQNWTFEEMISAIGWIDENHLLLAGESGLWKFEISTANKELICPIEANLTDKRSNDGRADPWGGFWVSTMSKEAEHQAGAIYRWYKGELRKVTDGITIPNGICFDKDRSIGYFADSAIRKISKISLDPIDGWPNGSPENFLDISKQNLEIDGAIIDTEGYMWTAVWDGSALYRISPQAEFVEKIETSIPRPTCPAFGGITFTDLYVTSAAIGLESEVKNGAPHGHTMRFSGAGKGLPEPRVLIEI
ncbi:SMP-30/gluconolactonase/LRE family protein [Hirschia litorea]|uniref:SMP-30/gluconolactonase/LRE family protein n=1 Tax=Hirschia litorea TaxID=1199156 RepID=A0ABW2IPB6_9PROT